MNIKALNNKLASLPRGKKILLLVSVSVMVGTFWYYTLLGPKQAEISRMNDELASLNKALKENQEVCKNIPAFQQEVEKVRQDFLLAQIQLPTEKEIPTLLKKIADLGSNAGLEFALFKPQAEVKKEFYQQLPIDIKVRGPYHNVANFFQLISALDRIVNIEEFNMGNPQFTGNLVTLETTCVATTYRFQPNASPEGKQQQEGASSGQGETDAGTQQE
ncbi:MAG: type 4a pilus biogenesis protein PilO [bacterium]